MPEASPFCGLRHLQEREASDMENGSDAAGMAALLGIHDFVVTAQTVRDGEVWLAIETTTTRLACPDCGVFGIGNGRRRVIVRDLPIAGGRRCWCGPSAPAVAVNRCVNGRRGQRHRR